MTDKKRDTPLHSAIGSDRKEKLETLAKDENISTTALLRQWIDKHWKKRKK